MPQHSKPMTTVPAKPPAPEKDQIGAAIYQVTVRGAAMAKHSSEAITAFLEEWKRLRQEGVTQKQFASDHGLSERTLRSWQNRFKPKAETPAEMIAKAQVLVDELQRMIDALRSGMPQVPSPAWQRWILDAACPSAIKP
jgi:DNA-binding transcriptional regulator YiaG